MTLPTLVAEGPKRRLADTVETGNEAAEGGMRATTGVALRRVAQAVAVKRKAKRAGTGQAAT